VVRGVRCVSPLDKEITDMSNSTASKPAAKAELAEAIHPSEVAKRFGLNGVSNWHSLVANAAAANALGSMSDDEWREFKQEFFGQATARGINDEPLNLGVWLPLRMDEIDGLPGGIDGLDY
jgi:hypothetical protein